MFDFLAGSSYEALAYRLAGPSKRSHPSLRIKHLKTRAGAVSHITAYLENEKASVNAKGGITPRMPPLPSGSVRGPRP